MAGANSNIGPVTGAPISFVWFWVPSSRRLVPEGSGPGSGPVSSVMPRSWRCSSTVMKVAMPLRARGKPA
ncbi:hypothetical protein AB0M20_15975 [Actinoplanes sp. NPDC051633]|uniref:hypothetical protein n=1 Tax=Actinoplanes sp. NPDC051633 TaxID=3155670 RepID=UPI00341D114B